MSESPRSASDPFARFQVGASLPPLTEEIDRRRLVRFAGAVDDYAEPHWDHLYMVEHGFKGVIVHGWLTFSVLTRMLARWAPPEQADYTGLSIRYLRPYFPGLAVFGGTVEQRDEAARTARLSLRVEDEAGQRLAKGGATLTFP